MSNQDDYENKLGQISAIAEQEIKSPTMPVDVYLQEAENLYHWCQDDVDALTGAGMEWAMAEDIAVRAGALREAQSRWFKKRFTHDEAEKQWQTASVEGYELRDQLLHSFRYAYRNQKDILNRVSAITDGQGHADMIQDLNDLAVLGQEHYAALAKINLCSTELEKAANSANSLSQMLASATADRESNNRTRVLRDQAFTYLKYAVDEVRVAGQYVFWRNEARLKGYISRYYKKSSGKSKTPAASTAEPATVS